ncbi:hypothetical protein K445DRAFT_322775 [Daldinia sp. EC12]|nr:hypothetical protein K445DRAFT_322775 [Daldinia sp. EC12]
MGLTMNLITGFGLNTIDWIREIKFITGACLLTTIIVISIMATSDRLAQSPIYNFAVDKFVSYFYKPSPRLRRGPIAPSQLRRPGG